MVLIALFPAALFRMVESEHTHQAKIAGDITKIQLYARAGK